MTTSSTVSLWRGSTRGVYFLIPDNEELSHGTYTIYQIRGLKKQVDLESLKSYEISAAAAEPYMQKEVTLIVTHISSLFSSIVAINLNDQEKSSHPFESHSSSHQTASELLSSILGVSLEEFIDNPEVANNGLESFMNDVASTMENSQMQNLDQTQGIKTSIDAVLETLQSRGLEISSLDTNQLIEDIAQAISEFSEELNNNFSKSSSGIETAAYQMREAALQIDSSFSDLSQNLAQGLKKLQNLKKNSDNSE